MTIRAGAEGRREPATGTNAPGSGSLPQAPHATCTQGGARRASAPAKFTFGTWTWDVAAAAAYARSHLEVRPVAVSDLVHLLYLVNVDPQRVDVVNLEDPILLGHLPDTRSLLPLDGWHRLTRAARDQVAELPAWSLSPSESSGFLEGPTATGFSWLDWQSNTALRRLDALGLAIERRDWNDTEHHYLNVRSLLERQLTTHGRQAVPQGHDDGGLR